jgi:hypothetical protein
MERLLFLLIALIGSTGLLVAVCGYLGD